MKTDVARFVCALILLGLAYLGLLEWLCRRAPLDPWETKAEQHDVQDEAA